VTTRKTPNEFALDLKAAKETLAERFQRFLAEIADTNWGTSPEAQLRTVEFLATYGDILPEGAADRLTELAAKHSGHSVDRIRYAMKLDEREERRRVLWYKEPKALRLPDEKLYPQDGWFGKYLLYAQHSEVPLAWHFWSAVAVLGAACRRNFYIDWGNHFIRPNTYAILVGPTGMRKSTAISTAMGILRELNRLLDVELGLPPELRITLLPEKVTPERLLNSLAFKANNIKMISPTKLREIPQQAIAMIAPDELVTLLGRENFHSGQMIHLLTTLYDCPKEFRASTLIRGDEVLKNVAISMIAGSTPEWMRTSMPPDVIGGGFAGRCMFIFREECARVYPKAAPLDPVTRGDLARYLMQLSTADAGSLVELSPEATVYYERMYIEGKEKVMSDPNLRGYLARKPTHVLRLGMILALSMGRTIVEEEDISLSHQIIDVEEQFLPDFFLTVGSHAESDAIDRVLATINSSGGAVSRQELILNTRRFLGSVGRLDSILSTLRQSGKVISEAKKDKSGKPIVGYRTVGKR